jgi:hypothetical protein
MGRRRTRRAQGGQTPYTPSTLSATEKRYRAMLQKIRDSRELTGSGKRETSREVKAELRQDYTRVRQQVLADFEDRIEQRRAAANPPLTEQELEGVSRVLNVHLPRWQRSEANLLRDAERFEAEGNLEGLLAVKEHLGIISNPQARTELGQAVEQVILEDFASDEMRQAADEVSSLERERDQFEIASALRQRGIIAATTRDEAPPPAADAAGSQYAATNAPRR